MYHNNKKSPNKFHILINKAAIIIGAEYDFSCKQDLDVLVGWSVLALEGDIEFATITLKTYVHESFNQAAYGPDREV